MPNYVNTNTAGGDAPVGSAIAITPGADPITCGPTRALWVGGGGDIEVVMAGSKNTVVFTSVPAGRWMPLMVTHVLAGNTSASNIVACM